MFKINEYFDGKVKSIVFETNEGQITVGVMKKGEYVFGTSTAEHMTIISGKMEVMLPGKKRWKTFKEFETFIVPKDVKYSVKVEGNTSYRCLYK